MHQLFNKVIASARKQLFCKLWLRLGLCGLQMCCFVCWLFIFFLSLSSKLSAVSFFLHLAVTVRGLAKCGTFSTKLQSKHQSSNLAQSFIRSTSPRISPNPCYRLPFCRGVNCRVGCAIGVFLFFQKEGKKKMKF